MGGFVNLRQFIDSQRLKGNVVDIEAEVDPYLEIAEIHRRVVAVQGPILFFHNVKGSTFPVVTNLFGTMDRVYDAFPTRPEQLVETLVKTFTQEFPPTLSSLWEKRSSLKQLLKLGNRKKRTAPIKEQAMPSPNLNALPMLTSWPEDGGPFLTLPLICTESVTGKPPNLGMYRVQRYSENEAGLHFQIAKGGGYHYSEAEERDLSLPVRIFLGGPPALILSSIVPLPENVPELLLCSLLQGEKLKTTPCTETGAELIGECEFALVGEAKPHRRQMEGPFGDHYGYYSLEHPFPVFECKKIYHRKDAIYPATVVGKPKQEDFYIGDFLQELLSPLFPVVMPGVKDLWSYGETGFHSLTAAVIQERFERESMHHAFRILGEGQLSFSKFLMLTDQPVDLKNFPLLLQTVLERFSPECDLFVLSNLSLDTLDYTGPTLNKGSRGIMLGTGEKKRDLPQTFMGTLPRPITEANVFCPGCLVLTAPKYEEFKEINRLLDHPDFQDWPLIILVDDSKKVVSSTTNFLWTIFTRFEPAADIHARHQTFRHHLCYQGPIFIDARFKPSYPKEVLCDPETYETVTKRWDRYFPQGQEMGDSLAADVH